MQTQTEIAAEAATLNRSQRNALRNAIGGGEITALRIERIGWKRRVTCQMYGVQQVVEVGPRGAILSREPA